MTKPNPDKPAAAGDEIAAQRQQGREWARELQGEASAAGQPFGWFEALYSRAAGDAGFIPWEMAAPRFRLKAWLGENPGAGLRAIDIGCGLGDNAACLVGAGYDVTAFDISETAVGWARKRFPDAPARFHCADLFAPPADWLGAFDLVHETYNLQAMPGERINEAMAAVAALAKPGGTVLVMCRGRREDEEPVGPPWPLTRTQLEGFEQAGLSEVHFEEFWDQRDEPIRHFLLEFRR